MPNQTWKWITESLLPLVVTEARQAGVDTEGWALDSRVGMYNCLVVVDENRAVTRVIRTFPGVRDATAFFEGMRFAMAETRRT